MDQGDGAAGDVGQERRIGKEVRAVDQRLDVAHAVDVTGRGGVGEATGGGDAAEAAAHDEDAVSPSPHSPTLACIMPPSQT